MKSLEEKIGDEKGINGILLRGILLTFQILIYKIGRKLLISSINDPIANSGRCEKMGGTFRIEGNITTKRTKESRFGLAVEHSITK